MKNCIKCLEEKDLAMFYKGINTCKYCVKVANSLKYKDETFKANRLKYAMARYAKVMANETMKADYLKCKRESSKSAHRRVKAKEYSKKHYYLYGNKYSAAKKPLTSEQRAVLNKKMKEYRSHGKGLESYRKYRSSERHKEVRRVYDKAHGYDNYTRCKFWGVKYTRFKKQIVFDRDGWTCSYCGKSLTEDYANVNNGATLDHKTPISIGGNHEVENCTTSCHSCNSSKGQMTYEDYMALINNKKTV